MIGVTVVIPTVEGREDLLRRALRSVASQILQPADTLVVIDHDRQGAWWARNEGLRRVQTDWLAWLDDDDELLPDHLQLLTNAAMTSTPPPDLVYSYPEVVGGRDPLAVAHHGQWVKPLGVSFGAEQEAHLRRQGNFIPVTYLVRTAAVRHVGGMPPSGGPGKEEDYQLLIGLLDAGYRFLHVPERTWRYHIHDRNTGGGWQGTGASNKQLYQERP
jgi:glycosyltransferase involved in cell wall biosynthesis